MPKPKKDRFVLQPPSVAYFKPQGIPMFQLDQVVLGVDEYEALRLVDYEGLQQKEAAERMEISRATCARILESAHRKVAEALTGGKAIRIEGGSYVLGSNRYRCRECNTSWDAPVRAAEARPRPLTCPRCKGDKVMDLAKQVRTTAPGSRPGEGGGQAPAGAPGLGAGRGRRRGRGWNGDQSPR